MKIEEAQTATRTLIELTKSKREVAELIKETGNEASATMKLWREKNKSRLIKLGVALILFPEPTPISETVGACFVAAGTVQRAIQNRAFFMEDIAENLKNTLREVNVAKQNMQI
jgi:hypothetical protein